MKREIKFRGKRRDNGEWLVGDLTHSWAGSTCIFAPCETGSCYLRNHQVDPTTVGQFTGLKAKDGKEVWEGDIVMVDYYDEDYPSPTFPFVVKFSDGAFCFADDGDIWCPISTFKILEVIGNIHDNPELLKGGEE